MIDPVTLAVLAVVAVGTSVISAIVGMGGGITLLAALFFTDLPHLDVVALHGVIQMVSNAARTHAYREHLSRTIAGGFFVGSLPGFALACLVVSLMHGAEWTESPWFKIGIGIWVFSALFKSRRTGDGVRLGFRGFAVLGTVMAPLSTILGATGPIIAPFFLRNDLAKEEVVVSKAACQVSTHVAKLGAITVVLGRAGGLGRLEELLVAAGLMSVSAIVGTRIGKALMPRVDEVLFRRLYRVVLAAAGAKILVNDGMLRFETVEAWLIPLLPY